MIHSLKLTFCFLLLSIMGYGQNKTLESKLQELETFMTDRIPTNHMSVMGYELSVKKCTLSKVTLLSDGTSHSTTYQIDNTEINSNGLEMDDESAEVYGFKDYWEVSIDGQWFHTEILIEEDALKLVEMLEDLQQACNI